MNIDNSNDYLESYNLDRYNLDREQDNNSKEKLHYYDTGWICPKCGSVYNPFIGECWRCNSLINSPGIPYLPIIYG